MKMNKNQKIPIKNSTNSILFTTTLTSFFNPVLGAAVNIALPSISKNFNANSEAMSWITMSYLLATVVFLIPFGKLSDIYGRRNMFLYGNVILTLGSVLCSSAFSITSLIIYRIIQGIGSAMIFSSSMAMITSAIAPEKRGRAIGYNVSAVYLGLTCAPMLGGFLTHAFGWRSLFYLNSFTGIIVIIAIILLINKEKIENKKEYFDYIGAIIYMISMTLLVYGFSKLPTSNAILLTGIGIAGIVLFINIELKHKTPLFDLTLFLQNRVFAFSNLAAFINYAATFAITFFLSLYLQYNKGYSASKSGFFLMFQPAIMTIVASFSGKLSDKHDAGFLASLGMAVNVFGLIMLVFINSIDNNLFLALSLMVLGFGFGMFSSPNTSTIMGSVEKKHLGIASATVATMRILGQVFSMATATMLLNIFVGGKKITPENYLRFNQSMKVSFIVFAVLCILGVFASLARKKIRLNSNKITS